MKRLLTALCLSMALVACRADKPVPADLAAVENVVHVVESAWVTTNDQLVVDTVWHKKNGSCYIVITRYPGSISAANPVTMTTMPAKNDTDCRTK